MRRITLLLLTTLLAPTCIGQNISNLQKEILNDQIQITYNLSTDKPATVEVFLQDSTGKEKKISERLMGHMGHYIFPGTAKKIIWAPKDTNYLNSHHLDNIILKAKPFLSMVFVEGGSFKMGCTDEQQKCDKDERRIHTVHLSDYHMSRYEISNSQYCIFLNQIGADPIGTYKRTDYIHISKPSCRIDYKDGKFVPVRGHEDYPVIEVTWMGAQAFCEWAGGRLPTEAEWEYAARGGQKSKGYLYSGSNQVNQVAWYDKNSKGKLHKRGEKEPNELGIYDMSGNVWEWCYDWYDDYPKKEQTNPMGPARGFGKVIRGGSWLYYGRFCRVANRGSSSPEYCFNNYGFRLVRPSR